MTSSRRKARNEMTVSICEAPGRAVTQQIAMDADIIIRTVFRIAASVQPKHVNMQECRLCNRKWRKRKILLKIPQNLWSSKMYHFLLTLFRIIISKKKLATLSVKVSVYAFQKNWPAHLSD